MDTVRRDRWIAFHLLRETVAHARDGWRAVDPARRRAWMAIAGAGFLVLLCLTVGLVSLARSLERHGGLTWERAWLEGFAAHGPLPFSWAIWVETPGNGVFLIPLVLTATAILLWRRKTLRALSLLGGFFLVDAAVILAWKIWPRARPDFIGEGLATPGGFSSFPSGHVTQTVVAFGLLVYFWSRLTRDKGETFFAWSLFTVVVAAVGLSRLRLGAHWPSDIAGGIIVGGAWLAILVLALERAEKMKPSRES